MEIKKSAVIGMGAVGTVYGNYLHREYGNNFAAIACGGRAENVRLNGAVLNGDKFYPRVVSCAADGFSPDLVIVCVKNYSLDSAIDNMRGIINKNTLILPLLNGVTATQRLKKAFPDNKVFYGLCVYIDAVRSKNGVKNTSRGIIQYGDADNTVPSESVQAVAKYLSQAGLHAEACPDMTRAIWKKWMLNVGCNQVSAVTGAAYSKMRIDTNLILFHEAMMEVVAVAKACSINLTENDALEIEDNMRTFSPDGKTSMLQDVEAKRKTEVDYFSGTVIKLGKKYNIPTPVNHVLYCLIKTKEQMY